VLCHVQEFLHNLPDTRFAGADCAASQSLYFLQPGPMYGRVREATGQIGLFRWRLAIGLQRRFRPDRRPLMPAPLFACSHAYVAACPSAGISTPRARRPPRSKPFKAQVATLAATRRPLSRCEAKVAERRVWVGSSHHAEWRGMVVSASPLPGALNDKSAVRIKLILVNRRRSALRKTL
jgi:hypothetical protein